jgi:sulfane dehydrogenase subunit SoxC
VSCAEWTGVKLSTLLDEAGIEPTAKWILAEGADAAGMSRSVPLAKAMDDALIALFQNGERIRPSNGYPIRLLLPGYEGNMHVKWLRRIKVTEDPTMTKDETSKYTMLLPDGKSLQFVFPIETKSVITQPSPGLTMKGPGLYEISGLAWSGYRAINKVEVSADGGRSWGSGSITATGPVDGANAVPHGVALERRASGPAKPRHGRYRLCSADARRAHRQAWQQGILPFQ